MCCGVCSSPWRRLGSKTQFLLISRYLEAVTWLLDVSLVCKMGVTVVLLVGCEEHSGRQVGTGELQLLWLTSLLCGPFDSSHSAPFTVLSPALLSGGRSVNVALP